MTGSEGAIFSLKISITSLVISLEDIKSYFLRELYNLLDDGMPRYFLPEK